jgi:NAD(P)-dependent dehydrogenase (short-subunit alcohol dehydrogenase family)
MDVKGASALVTGGASGLGEATSRALASAGALVCILDLERQRDRAEALAAEIKGRFVPADVADPDQVQAAVDAALEMGPLRVNINCAGIGWAARLIGKDGSPHDMNLYRKVIEVNLIGTFNTMRMAASAMNRSEPLEYGERGVIVNTASVAAFDGQIGQIAYSASKGGVVGMTLPAARDLAPAGIRVCTIAPGLIDTPLLGTLSDEARAALSKDVVFPKRLGHADDYAKLVMHIVDNGYLNGETIRMDAALRMPPR